MDYTPPVDQLLKLGRPKGRDWLDYIAQYQLTTEHVPELIRLALDEFEYKSDEETPEVYSSIHAWRTLGQLKAVESIDPLITLVENAEDDDWVWEGLPMVFGMIGPAAIPALQQSLARQTGTVAIGLTIVDSLEAIAKAYPEVRNECVAILTATLEKASENDPGINAGIIHTLTELKVMEALPVIERAFATGNVDEMYMGDWDDVQVEFGLKAPDPNKVRKLPPEMQQIRDMMQELEMREEQLKREKEQAQRAAQHHQDRLTAEKKAKDKARAKRKQAKKQKKRK